MTTNQFETWPFINSWRAMDDASLELPVTADTFVLLKSVEGLLDVVQTEGSVYCDARRRLVDSRVRKPNLLIATGDMFYVAPTRVDLHLLHRKLGRLGARVRQLGGEREAARVETEAAVKQLSHENEHLREELTRLRAKLLNLADNCSFS
jgi:hypothetical protein